MKAVFDGKQGNKQGKSGKATTALQSGIQTRNGAAAGIGAKACDATGAGTWRCPQSALQVAGPTQREWRSISYARSPQVIGRERTVTPKARTEAGHRGARNSKKNGDVLRQAPQVKYAYIEAHMETTPTALICRALGVARSGYYGWKARGESERSKQNSKLLARIKEVHRTSREAYGAVKTWRELNLRGIACGKHRVARLRRQAGIEARRKRRFRVIVENHHTAPAAPKSRATPIQRCHPQSSLGGRWHLHPHPAGLSASGGLVGFALSPGGWLGYGRQTELATGHVGSGYGAPASAARARSDSPYRPGNVLCSTRLPGEIVDAWPASEHEPTR